VSENDKKPPNVNPKPPPKVKPTPPPIRVLKESNEHKRKK
jgi:hypothetical protein